MSLPRRPVARESSVEARLREACKRAGLPCLKFTSPGTPGVPDRLVIRPDGRAVFVEVKRPGEKPRPLQLAVMARLEKAGARCLVYDGRDDAAVFVSSLLAIPF